MSHTELLKLAKDDPPLFPDLDIVFHVVDGLTFTAIEGGMGSGRTSVAIHGTNSAGETAILEMSVDQLKMATRAMAIYAEQFGDPELP